MMNPTCRSMAEIDKLQQTMYCMQIMLSSQKPLSPFTKRFAEHLCVRHQKEEWQHPRKHGPVTQTHTHTHRDRQTHPRASTSTSPTSAACSTGSAAWSAGSAGAAGGSAGGPAAWSKAADFAVQSQKCWHHLGNDMFTPIS